MYSLELLKREDPEIAQAISDEMQRQNDHLELIASENWVSKAVMAAMGSPLTNKYAEGYPGHRYYGGCQYIDVVEDLARERAKKLFGCTYANVQPHSGAQANLAVEFAILKPGDTLMGMDLNMGGHLTHGSSANISGTYFHVVPYGVDENGYLDYDKLMDLAMENHPKLIIAGASAYARTIDFTKFRKVADACGAVLMADIAHIAGLVATGLHPSPIGVADIVTTTTHKTLRGPRGGMILANEDAAKEFKLNKAVFPGIQGGPLEHVIAGKAVCFKEDLQLVSDGTDNHLMVIDLTSFDETGKEVEKWLDDAHITVNKETIPNETRSPFVTSGLRLGTPAVTTRGLKEADMDDLAEAISLVIRNREEGIEPARAIVAQITAKYPLDLTEN